MHHFINLGNRIIFVHAIASAQYTDEIEEDGDVIDKEPINLAYRKIRLLIKLLDGSRISLKDDQASKTWLALHRYGFAIAGGKTREGEMPPP